MRRAGECRIDLVGVAVVIVERDVIRDVVVELRRARFCRFRGIGDGGQGLDIDLDRFRRVAGLRQRLRHHEGDGIANKADLVSRQRAAAGLQQRRPVAALQRQAAGEGAVIGGGEIGAGPHPEHARHRPGGRGVDALMMPWAWLERTIQQ